MPAKQMILVAMDFGPSSDEAVRQAHEWAISSGAELVACFIIPEALREQCAFPPAYADDAVALMELERRTSDLVCDRVSALTRRAEGDFKIVVDGGRADLGIVRVSDEMQASLIVVGNRQSSDLDRILLGSISERVVRYASCSVLIARSRPRSDHVVAATDLSDAALPAVTAAAEIAALRKASLTVLHCVPSPGVGNESGFGPHPSMIAPPRIDPKIVSRLKRVATDGGVAARFEVIDGDPGEAIVRRANQLDADLIVVGTRGRTGLPRIAIGSVAETVARTASCPVLAVRLGAKRPSRRAKRGS
jgi:nucleotide-binding universal stress UspA family protein